MRRRRKRGLPVFGASVLLVNGRFRSLVSRGSRALPRRRRTPAWAGSARYWDDRYRSGGSSGPGSTGQFAAVKAKFVNDYVRQEAVRSVIEFGCGDGLQLSLANYPAYVGLDVSEAALSRCAERFARDTSKSFFLYSPFSFVDRQRVFRADLALSLEVIFHLVEDDVYGLYMQHLFDAADRFVVVCSTDVDLELDVPHRRHRRFSAWVDEHALDWERVVMFENPLTDWGDSARGALQHFYVYARR
jgi:hypothetical protein